MRPYLLISPLLLVLLLTVACTNQQQARTLRQEQQVMQVGGSAAQTLAGALFGRVSQAIEQEGVVYAVDFCSMEAQPLTAEVDRQLGSLDIKRTTFQYRNPRNAPDALEAEVLQHFEDALAAGQPLPENYIQFVNANEYRYYQPLKIREGCLNCHGDPAQFDPELRQILNERYPNDQATGYEEGDFRGVIRVSVPTRLLSR